MQHKQAAMTLRLISKISISSHTKLERPSQVMPMLLALSTNTRSRQFSALKHSSAKASSSFFAAFSVTTGNTIPLQTRWMTTAKPDFENPELLYEGPMARLITTLKMFSLSSAVLSTVGLPTLMIIKGIDMYTGIHIAMVGTTIAGSIGSTLGLQYIFAPYVYKLERIPIRQCSFSKNDDGEEASSDKEEDTKTKTSAETANGNFLLKATTRSVFATKVDHVFDPEIDIEGVPRGTIRPFCSFFAKGKPLYIHEQMIQDPTLSQNLFIKHATPIKQQKNPDPDDEFL